MDRCKCAQTSLRTQFDKNSLDSNSTALVFTGHSNSDADQFLRSIAKKRERNRDAYRTFVRKVSLLNEVKNEATTRNELQNFVHPIEESQNPATDVPNFVNKSKQVSNETVKDEGPRTNRSITNDYFVNAVRKYSSNPAPYSSASNSINQQRKTKVKNGKKSKDLLQGSKSLEVNPEDFKDFLKNATVHDLQRYYATFPSKTDCKPPEFAIDTYLRRGKLEADYNRMKELRAQNFGLVCRINVIQRSKGRVDHINTRTMVVSKYEDRIKKIKKLEKANCEFYDRLTKVTGNLPTRNKLAADWKEKVALIAEMAKTPLILPGIMSVEKVEDPYIERCPKVFLEFSVRNANVLGRMVLALYNDLAPKTVTNFVRLCKNFRQNLQENRRQSDRIAPHLAGSPIHRIFPDLYFEGGDIVRGQGSFGRAAQGVDFYPENINVPHNHEGTISMTITPEGRINSLFAINFRKLELLTGRRPAFGRVIKGFKVLKMIEDHGSKNGKPKEKIIITNCGLV